MISKPYRFHGHNALSFVYRQGRTVRSTACALRYVRNPRRSRYRAAVVVGKKVSKSAVVRNRIRRRIYEQVRGLVSPQAPYDIVITVFDEKLAGMPEKQLNNIIRGILQTSGILDGGITGDRGVVDNSATLSEKSPKNYTMNSKQQKSK